MCQAVWWGIEGTWLEIEGQGCPGRKMTASQAKGAACAAPRGGEEPGQQPRTIVQVRGCRAASCCLDGVSQVSECQLLSCV